MTLTSSENPILRALRKVFSEWPESVREEQSASLIRIFYRMQTNYRESHDDPEDWMRFDAETVKQMDHAREVLRRTVVVYGLDK